MVQTKYFCLTIYELDKPFLDVARNIPNVVYCIAQQERGEQGERDHYQAYFCFERSKRLDSAIGLFHRYWPTCHVERRRGSHQEAKAYCRKENTRVAGPYELGDDSAIADVPGSSGGLKRLAEAAVEGKSDRALAELDMMTYCNHFQKLRALRQAILKPTFRDVHVTWIYGLPGAGKTQYVWESTGPDAFILAPVNGKVWFDGYNDEDTIIMDNLTANTIPWNYLMSILDKYPLRVEIKGGTVIARWTKIYVTSVAHPMELVPANLGAIQTDYRELRRRVHRLLHIDENHVVKEVNWD